MLQVLDVSAHNRGFRVEGISFELGAGEIGALMGRSGSGKTTLMKVLAGVKAPDHGRVLVAGNDAHRRSRRGVQQYLLRETGIVHQHPRPFPGLTTIQYAATRLMSCRMKPDAAMRQVEPLLERLGLRRELHKPAGSLSGGELQRVDLVLAMSTAPLVLFADEPTGSLDSATGETVLSFIQELACEKNTSVLIATHDPAVEAISDKVFRLTDGRLGSQEQQELLG